jgi:hypothetical protein
MTTVDDVFAEVERKRTLNLIAPYTMNGHRAEDLLDELLNAELVVTRHDHQAALRKTADWQDHLADQLRGAEVMIGQLRRLVDRTSAERLSAVFADLEQVPSQRTAKHDEDCWKRHTGCLARRLRDQLSGVER